MLGAEAAELEAMRDRLCRADRKIATLARAVLFLAEHVIQAGGCSMSATTDAIKAKLTALEADVERAASHAAVSEASDLEEIEARLDAIGVKVHAMVGSPRHAVTESHHDEGVGG